MAFQGISTGTGPNQGDGDTLVDGAVKINSNFQEIYNSLGGSSGTIPVEISISGSNLNFSVPGVGTTTLTLS